MWTLIVTQIPSLTLVFPGQRSAILSLKFSPWSLRNACSGTSCQERWNLDVNLEKMNATRLKKTLVLTILFVVHLTESPWLMRCQSSSMSVHNLPKFLGYLFNFANQYMYNDQKVEVHTRCTKGQGWGHICDLRGILSFVTTGGSKCYFRLIHKNDLTRLQYFWEHFLHIKLPW